MAHGRGISLLEVLVSLLLLGVGFGVWVLSHFGRSDVTLESAGQLLVDDLRSARSHALVMGEPVYLWFEGDTYRAVDGRQETLFHPRTGLPFVRDYRRDAVFEGVVIEYVETEAIPGVLFDARGEIASGARIVLRHGDDAREITADSESGAIAMRPLAVGVGPGATQRRLSATNESLGATPVTTD